MSEWIKTRVKENEGKEWTRERWMNESKLKERTNEWKEELKKYPRERKS